MFLLESGEIFEHVNHIIHEDTQQQQLSIDLTVNKVFKFTRSGSLDFGGSEFEPAVNEIIKPVKQSPSDDYGWWNLKEGIYKAEFNENLENVGDMLLAVSPHDHVAAAGLTANTRLYSPDHKLEQLTMNFHVPMAGCNIKENARMAKLHVMAE